MHQRATDGPQTHTQLDVNGGAPHATASRATCFALAFIAGVGVASSAQARPAFVGRIPNGSFGGCLTCHDDDVPAGNAPRNVFGVDFDAGGWSQVCSADSDADGQSNGQELGDPGCSWSVGEQPARAAAISLPGDPQSTSSDPDGQAPPAPPSGETDDRDNPAPNCKSGPEHGWWVIAVLGVFGRRRCACR